MNDNLSFIDKLVNDDGVKFTVTTNFEPEIYIKLFVTIVGSVIVSALAVNLLGGAFKN